MLPSLQVTITSQHQRGEETHLGVVERTWLPPERTVVCVEGTSCVTELCVFHCEGLTHCLTPATVPAQLSCLSTVVPGTQLTG